MVVRINRKTGESFILYNAGESEITALAMDPAGNLYAATGEAGERQAANAPQSKPETNGRPPGEGGEKPIPATKPGNPPKPPEPPHLIPASRIRFPMLNRRRCCRLIITRYSLIWLPP